MPVIQITPEGLDRLVSRAKTESWKELIILGRFSVFEESPHPERWLFAAEQQIFRLKEPVGDLVEKVSTIHSLTSLHLSDHDIDDKGATVIAQSLRGLTSLSLDDNRVGVEGAKAIARSLTRLKSLNLANNRIEAEGARAIARSLAGLAWLDLGRNRITNEGAKAIAGSLVGLNSLYLDTNGIGTAGAKALAESLTGLSRLDLWSNSIGDNGAQAIARSLTGLTSLNLRYNNIGDDGAVGIARSLIRLTSLNLAGNHIGDDGARAIARYLSRLTSLNVHHNRIGIDGAASILDAWSKRPNTDELNVLDLRYNGDFSDLLPTEVLESPLDPAAILAAYRRIEAGANMALNEAKLLVVGNAEVGKTSLIRFLVEGLPCNRHEDRTTGIVTHERIATTTWSPESGNIQLNIWDFGGQDIMWGTHQYFLTPRSLYLLVLSDRREREDDRSIYYWLKTIRRRGGNSPVLVVINKSDQGKRTLRVDESGLHKDYPEIVGFFRTSCNDDDFSRRSVQALRRRIVDTAAQDPRLKHVRDPFPQSWLRIKSEVAATAKDRAVLPVNEFEAICENDDDPAMRVSDEAERRSLLRLLNEIGTVITHGLEPNARAVSREITLLDPNWLTQAIYKVLDMADSSKQRAVFSEADLNHWLDPKFYPQRYHEFILHMMQDEEVGLCFRLSGTGAPRYLVPEALSPSAPFYENWPPESLRFRYCYDLLPRALVPRFIGLAHDLLADPPTIWRTGAVFSVLDCNILVRADMEKCQIDILVDGPAARRRSALAVIASHFNTVHMLKPECGPSPCVPLPDNPETHVEYEHLLMLEDQYGPNHKFHPPGAERLYSVRELLEGVRHDRRIDPRAPEGRMFPYDDTFDGDSIRRSRSADGGNGFVRWWLFSFGVALGAVGLFHILYWTPSAEARFLIGVSALVFVVTFFIVAFFNPKRFYRRQIAYAIIGGFLTNLGSFAATIAFQSSDATAAVDLTTKVNGTFNIAWALIIIALSALEWQQIRNLSSNSASRAPRNQN